MKYGYVVGVGLAGLTMAERLANVLGKKVLVIEKEVTLVGTFMTRIMRTVF